MTATELLREVRLLGHDARERRDEVQVRTCAFCGNDRWNLELSATKGVYHCWACGESGTVRALLVSTWGGTAPPGLEVDVRAGDRERATPQAGTTTSPLETVPSAAALVARRGISRAEARALGIEVGAGDDRHRNRVVVPLREYWDGRPCGWVSRAVVGEPKYLAEVRCPDSLPGWSVLGAGVHVLCEGPFDGLSVRRAGVGAAVLLGKGRDEQALAWAARVPFGDALVVMLDGDARDRATSLATTLRTVHHRTAVAALVPGVDPGDLKREAVAALVRAAASAAEEAADTWSVEAPTVGGGTR